ncbi:MAG: carbohydrate kinase family protein [bacterium]
MPGAAKKFTIAGLGEAMWDLYEKEKHPGGTPANIVCHVQQLGDRGVLISRVGHDELGEELVRALQKRGLSTAFVQRDPRKSTGQVHISLDSDGVPHYQGYKDVAFDHLTYPPGLDELAAQVDAVVFGTLAQRADPTRQTIFRFLQTATQALKVFDLGYAHVDPVELARILPDSLAMADIVKMNVAEMNALRQVLQRNADSAPELMAFLIGQFSLKLVAVTLGAKGCELFSPYETCAFAGLPVRVVDTTGAGDAFTAGLIHKFLRGASLDEIGEFANLMGAYLCTKKGATPIFEVQSVLEFQNHQL